MSIEQKIPSVNYNDIVRIIRRDFLQSEFTKVEGLLQMYKSESEKGRNRIYASILKLSEGNIDLVRKYVKKANVDYRDIIALSEYPNYTEKAFDDDLSPKKKEQLINDDAIQYEQWFNR